MEILKQLMIELDEVINMLKMPLTDEESECGWNLEAKKSMAEFFKNLKQRIEKYNSVIEDDKKTSIMRGLDFWGISKGKLFDKALIISKLITQMSG